MKHEKIKKTKKEWKEILPPHVFSITREEGTEPAFHNEYWQNKEKGIYVCSNCELILFDSAHKFESNTGWPSFYSFELHQRITYYGIIALNEVIAADELSKFLPDGSGVSGRFASAYYSCGRRSAYLSDQSLGEEVARY